MSNTERIQQWPFRTDFGWVVLQWNEKQLREYIWEPLKERLASSEDAGSEEQLQWQFERAVTEVNSNWKSLLMECVRAGLRQAIQEAMACGLISATFDKHERWRIANNTADAAREVSLERLMRLCRVEPIKQGEHRKLTDQQWLENYLSERQEKEKFRDEVMRTIAELLQDKQRTRSPSMSAVAVRMDIGQKNTKSGNDTGSKLLSKKLEWLEPGQKGKEVFKELVQLAKTEQANK